MNEDAGASPPEVFAPAPSWTIDELEEHTPYLATVNGVVPYGVFVDVTEHVSGLVHESNLVGEYDVDDELVVELANVQENGDVAFTELPYDRYDVTTLEDTREVLAIAEISEATGQTAIEGRVTQIKQTSGPTIIHVSDGSGVLPCAAFAEAGVRAHPEIEMGDYVRVVGTPDTYGDGLQLEVETISSEDAGAIRADMETRIDDLATPAAFDPLVEWDALDALEDNLVELATLLRRAVLEHRPILVRHHADGDGMCAAVPVTMALERFIQATHGDDQAPQHLVRRSPSRAPFYEMEDSTRDLNRALKDREEHGQRLPMLLMLDNGSTAEDVPGYRNLAHYDIPIAVVDHHHPDEEAVAGLLAAHVNPYLVGEDYRVTTGMLCVELARLIDPEITDRIRHVPAVAGIADRSEADVMTSYLALAEQEGYDREAVTQIGDALDYASHWLRYQPGEPVIRDVMGVTDARDRHQDVVDLLAGEAQDAIDRQLQATLPHVESDRLPNGAHLHRIDLDDHAHRFEYPAPGRTTGAVHDHMAMTEQEPTITIGFGPDFCVLRSDGVRLDIPDMVDELQAEVRGGGVSGGGHLVVGSIKFIAGRRDAVIDSLVEKMGEAALDEELTSTPPSSEFES